MFIYMYVNFLFPGGEGLGDPEVGEAPVGGRDRVPRGPRLGGGKRFHARDRHARNRTKCYLPLGCIR